MTIYYANIKRFTDKSKTPTGVTYAEVLKCGSLENTDDTNWPIICLSEQAYTGYTSIEFHFVSPDAPPLSVGAEFSLWRGSELSGAGEIVEISEQNFSNEYSYQEYKSKIESINL